MSEQGEDSYHPQFDHSYAKWDELQMEQYVDWVNALLRDRSSDLRVTVDNFGQDLSDGVVLLHLIEVLSGKSLPNRAAWSRRKPRYFLAQKLDNVQSAITHMERVLSIKVIGCHPNDIVNANTKQTLGLIFLLSQKIPAVPGLPVLPTRGASASSRNLLLDNIPPHSPEPSPRIARHDLPSHSSTTPSSTSPSSVVFSSTAATKTTSSTPSTSISLTIPPPQTQSSSNATTVSTPRGTTSATMSTKTSSSSSSSSPRTLHVGGSFSLSTNVQDIVSKAAAGALPGTEVRSGALGQSTSGEALADSGGETAGRQTPIRQTGKAPLKNLQLLRVKGMADVTKQRGVVLPVQAAVRGWIARTAYKNIVREHASRLQYVTAAFQASPSALRGLVRIQSYARYLAHESPAIRSRVHARKIAQEIVSTEENYIVCLKNLKNKFLAPLLEQPLLGLIPSLYHQPLRSMIGTLQPIIRTSKHLLSTLKERMSKLGVWYWGQDLGSVFFDFAAYLKQYQFFINDYNTNLQMLRLLDTNYPEVNRSFTMNSLECNRLDFASLLIQPIQRIPRYLMLLSDLLKRTGAEHPHYSKLLEARDKLSNIADHINQGKAAAENRATLLQIAQKCENLDSPLVDPSRRYVREGMLSVLKPNAETLQRYVFLFSDMLLITKTTRTWRRTLEHPGAGNKKSPATADSKPLFTAERTHSLNGDSWFIHEPASSAVAATGSGSAASVSSLSGGLHSANAATVLSSPQLSKRSTSSEGSSSSSSSSSATMMSNAFSIMPMNLGPVELTFIAPDASEKASWMAALDDVSRELGEQKKSRHGAQPYPIPPVETSFDDGVDYQGIVWRRSSKSPEWSERRLILKNDMLYSARLEPGGEQQPLPFTPVISCSIRVSPVMDRPHSFEVLISKPHKKNVILSCQSNAERFEWIRYVRTTTEKIIEQHARNLDRQAAAQQVRNNAARLRGKLDPAIEAILDQAGNDVCADCAAPDLEWVCLSRGVFLCATCGSIHRRLSGQQIISLTRGRWSPEKIRQLQGLPGNMLANELYEKHLDSEQKKPGPSSSNAEKTTYIQLKYNRAADARVEQALNTRKQNSFSADLSFPATSLESPLPGLTSPLPSASPSQASASTVAAPQIGSHSLRSNRRQMQEGWVSKHSKRRGLKNVYAVLRRKKLSLFADEQRKKLIGSINLYLARVMREPAEPGSFVFKIISPAREYLFSVKSPSELESWITSLNRQIDMLKNNSVKSLKRKKDMLARLEDFNDVDPEELLNQST